MFGHSRKIIGLLFLLIIFSGSTSKVELGKKIPLSGNIEQMKYFFDSLKNADREKIRIAHYGDSIILGDVITEYVRHYFQELFGGKGPGFIDIYSNVSKMRESVLHDFSDNWSHTAINTRNPEKKPVGISGSNAQPADKSWVSYKCANDIKSLRSFKDVKLFYSHAQNNSKVKLTFSNGAVSQTKNLTNGSLLNVLEVKPGKNIKSVKLDFTNCDDSYIYGVSLESSTGVYVDNFPISGNSGVSLSDIPEDLLKRFSEQLKYKLIILNYGVNVSTPNSRMFKIYENKMVKVINNFKKIFPETSFLLVSVADKTVKRGGNFVTDRNVPKLLRTQQKIAKKTGIAFWNLFETMGGKNSMNQWVSNAPPLALKDYTHFTHEGGNRVAKLLFDAILDEYNKYK